MNWDNAYFILRDYWKRNSLRVHFKRLLVLLSAVYLLYMYATRDDLAASRQMVTVPVTATTNPATAPESVFKHSAQPATMEDLRPQMTTQQSMFYWQSFQKMMEYGKALEPKEFDGKVIRIAYVVDTAFKAANGLYCRPFSEKVEMAGQWNKRNGVACRKAPESWCRQLEGEPAQCRAATDTGALAEMEADTGITLHNLGVDWDRNIRKLPGF